jgi:hypothetical protein
MVSAAVNMLKQLNSLEYQVNIGYNSPKEIRCQEFNATKIYNRFIGVECVYVFGVTEWLRRSCPLVFCGDMGDTPA